MKTKSTKKLVSVALGLTLLSNTVAGHAVMAAPAVPSIEVPTAPAWGHFVDSYKNNNSGNLSVASNPTIGMLSGFLELWTPGTEWNNGTKLNADVLNYNIDYVANLSKTRTEADEIRAYYDDRRNQSYGATEGLGALADVYREKSGTYTTITSIPADATSVKYNDGNGANKAGDSSSELGKMVDLIGALRGNYASTTPAKNFYSYMRPYRWAEDTSLIVPTLVPAISATPATDGGFPSGHTNASFLASYALAYAVPERFQELMTRASEMGNSRIVAGMHSPLDVIGGRVMATALAAAALADPDNAELKQAAYDQAHDVLLKETGTSEDRFTDYEQNKKRFTERLTFGFTQINDTTKPVAVPKGAEVLLETRQPYLSDEQRRAVLATTAIASGYPVLDDPEGWGRLNLFAAADGYGAFQSDVTVVMDASQGGFHAKDLWRNNIAGAGKLTKEGSGELTLAGDNTYAGGTELKAGTLVGGSAAAFGAGAVTNNGGTLAESVTGKVTIGGDFTQSAEGTLELSLASANDVLEVKGAVKPSGKLHVSFADNYVPAAGTLTLISHGANQRTGQFSAVEIEGLPGQYNAQVVYQSGFIGLQITSKTGSDNTSGSGNTNPSTGANNGTIDPVANTLTVTAQIDSQGNATATINDAHIQTLIGQAQSGGTLTLNVAPADKASAIGVTLSKAAVSSLAGSRVKETVVVTQWGTLTFDEKTLDAIAKAEGATVQIKMATRDAGVLSTEAKALVGARPVLDITVVSGSANLSSFDGGTVQLAVPYTPAQGEDTSAIVIYYINANGKANVVANSGYHNGKVVATTDHLSQYAVGYNKISFGDTATHWGTDYISYLAARGLVDGSGSNQFTPNRSVTRAEFAKMLAGIAGANTTADAVSGFDDVQAGAWYVPYVAWAAEHDIVKGSGNNRFNPNAAISREEMSVMLKRFADYAGYTLPKSVSEATFADQSSISGWAADAVKALQQADVLAGKGANAFDPKGSVTRAEAAKVLASLHRMINNR